MRETPIATHISPLLMLMSVICLALFFAPLDLPEDRMQPSGTVMLDASGAVLQRDAIDGLRIPVELSQVAPVLVQATIAAEDQRFHHHPGVDPIAMLRALLEWRTNPSGASTITQQLARKLYLKDADSPLLVRKAREALLALQLEARRSNDDILKSYLNELYSGRGADSREAAARVYS